MNNQIIQLEAYRLIRIKARDIVEPVDDAMLGSYTRGVVDLQTELYKLLSEKAESEDITEEALKQEYDKAYDDYLALVNADKEEENGNNSK